MSWARRWRFGLEVGSQAGKRTTPEPPTSSNPDTSDPVAIHPSGGSLVLSSSGVSF